MTSLVDELSAVPTQENWDAETCSSGSESESSTGFQAGHFTLRAGLAAGLLAVLAIAGLATSSIRSSKAFAASTNADVLQGSINEELLRSRGLSYTYAGDLDDETSRPTIGGIPDSLAPPDHRHDGNRCEDDEELSNGLCYKRCSLLTNGVFAIRTSAWTCCSSHPCNFMNQKLDVSVCSGFDIAGDRAGNGCPHAPGACLENEELSIGMCYKKCSTLTANQYPHRVAAATCCKTQGVACFNPFNIKTSKAFNVGGGKGDGNDATPSGPHLPLAALTEAVTKDV